MGGGGGAPLLFLGLFGEPWRVWDDLPQAALLPHRQNFLVQLIPAVFLFRYFALSVASFGSSSPEASFWLLRGLGCESSVEIDSASLVGSGNREGGG